MAYDLPTAWKMDGLELSIEQKLNYLAAHVAALEASSGGSTVSVTAEYTQQTYNNKLATITVDDTATSIYAPKVSAAPEYEPESVSGATNIGSITIGSTTKTFYVPIALICTEYDEDSTTYLSATYSDLFTSSGTCVCYLSYGDEHTNNLVYLEKLWDVTENDTTTYYAKFGSKTYSAETDYDPMTLVTL